MATTTAHAPGTFCWPELYTTDQAGAKKFYSALFGWQIRDIPMGPDAVYTIFTKNGAEAAACYGSVPEMVAQGVPPHWMSYVSVASADDATAKVKANGGTVLKEPFDIPGIGRMAALRDPSGAAFCVWEAKPSIGVTVLEEPNTLAWTELVTSDPVACEAFYRAVFGWGVQDWPMADGSTYKVFKRGESMAAGMMKLTPEMGPMPSCWGVYYQVEDCDGTAARGTELGGKVVAPPFDVPDVGRIAWLTDPAGAVFCLMQPAKQG